MLLISCIQIEQVFSCVRWHSLYTAGGSRFPFVWQSFLEPGKCPTVGVWGLEFEVWNLWVILLAVSYWPKLTENAWLNDFNATKLRTCVLKMLKRVSRRDRFLYLIRQLIHFEWQNFEQCFKGKTIYCICNEEEESDRGKFATIKLIWIDYKGLHTTIVHHCIYSCFSSFYFETKKWCGKKQKISLRK